MRPDWDSYFIEIARAVALRGDCTRSQVGAVLVEDRTHRILSSGFNGTVPGAVGCLDGGCPRGLLSLVECPSGGDYSNCIAKHAERNCLEYAERYYRQWDLVKDIHGDWVDVDTLQRAIHFSNCTMYITRKPCDDCQTLLRSADVTKVVYLDEGCEREVHHNCQYDQIERITLT